jgi:hypothetical protein
MHIRTKDQTNPGKFAFECIGYNGKLFAAQGGFATAQEADRAAEAAERAMMTMHGVALPDMTDDEILAELGL